MVRLREEYDFISGSNNLFQFQYGAIKRPVHWHIETANSYFNSSMVRLRGLDQRSFDYAMSYFNSSMVRLRVNFFLNSTAFSQFQFQYGAIESNVPDLFRSAFGIDFNSSMVRLRGSPRRTHVWTPCNFNSSMVRLRVSPLSFRWSPFLFQFQYGAIESLRLPYLMQFYWNFNSSMVRLRANVITILNSALSKFQFQYGAIKRLTQRPGFLIKRTFQFQYGAIKRAHQFDAL